MIEKSGERWRLLGFLFFISLTTYIDRVNISVAGARMGPELGLTRVEFGTIFSAFVLGYALFQIPGGWLGDRFGHKRVLAFALLWWSVFTALTAWAGKSFLVSALGIVPALCLVRFLIGVGEAAAYPCASGLVRRWFPSEERGLATGIVFAGIGVGSTVTPPLVAWLMVGYGWESAFYAAGAFGVALAAVFYFSVPARPPQPDRSDDRHMIPSQESGELPDAAKPVAQPFEKLNVPWKSFLKSGQLWLLTLSYFFNGYVAYIFFSWFYLYLVDVRGFTLLRGSFFAALPFLAMALGSPLGGVLGDRLIPRLGRARARRAVVFAGLVPATLLLFLGGSAENAYLAIAILSLAAGLLLLALSSYWATAIELMPSHPAIASGIMNMGTNLGGVISPVLTPWLAARYGWTAALGVGAASCLCAALLWIFIGKADDAEERMRESRHEIAGAAGENAAG
jgi:ACS family glucarate transporter-like MFS transporter